MAHRLAAAFVIAGVIASAEAAHADDEVAPSAPTPKAPPHEGHHFFNLQAFGLLVRRISFGYELQPATHHSFTISSWLQYPGGSPPNVAEGGALGVGSELGYRYYASAPGPSGPFFGASLIGGYYVSKYDFYDTEAKRTFYAQYGVALDMGYAFHIDRTITGVLAVGAQRTWIDLDADEITPYARLVVGEGVRPRVLLQIGRLF